MITNQIFIHCQSPLIPFEKSAFIGVKGRGLQGDDLCANIGAGEHQGSYTTPGRGEL